METKIAQDLLKFVNDPWVIEDLTKYVDYRIEFNKSILENATSWDEVKLAQGAIKELRRFKTLRDEVLKASRHEKGN